MTRLTQKPFCSTLYYLKSVQMTLIHAGFIDPGWLHTAELHDLQPGAAYAYNLPDCASSPANFSLQLPPPAAADTRTRFIVYVPTSTSTSRFCSLKDVDSAAMATWARPRTTSLWKTGWRRPQPTLQPEVRRRRFPHYVVVTIRPADAAALASVSHPACSHGAAAAGAGACGYTRR
jgi:hypothetical protein